MSLRADDARIAAVAAHVTDRDRAVCEALYEHRVLTVTEVAQLHFDSLERARKRLALLHQLGVLDRFRPYREQGSHPYHYLLDRLGAQLIAAERGIDPADLDWTRAKSLRLVASSQLRHLVEASGFFTRLAQALRGCRVLRCWSGPASAAALSAGATSFVPTATPASRWRPAGSTCGWSGTAPPSRTPASRTSSTATRSSPSPSSGR
jgi:hypothetical protein